jgi:predicted exporter
MRLWRLAAIAWLAVVLAAGSLVAQRFAGSAPLETDLMALLPPTEKNPTAEVAVKALADQLGNRALFLVGHGDAATAGRAARSFVAQLESTGAFVRVVVEAPRTDPRTLTGFYAPYRAGLLAPADRDALVRADYAAQSVLLRRLHQPFQTGITTDLGVDPFGYLQRWLGYLPLTQTRLSVSDGLLSVRDGGTSWVLVLGEPGGSAFDAATQERVVTAVGAAERMLHTEYRDARLLRTGAIFYGEAARSSAKREVDLIGGGSLVGIVLMMWLLFRSVGPLVLSLVTVACGIVCAMAAVLLADARIHLITLVFGASLIGEAVDYAIQYFAARLDAGERWQADEGRARLLPGLAVALATSLIGYGALTMAPFPAIRQIALFAFTGLATAWISVVLFLPLMANRPGKRRDVRVPQQLLAFWQARATPRRAVLLATVLLLVSLPGWLQLSADDDVRQLITRPHALVAQEERIRALAGASGSGRFFLIEGDSDEEALRREEALTARLRQHLGPALAGFTAISDFVPSVATQAENRRRLAAVLPTEIAAPLFAAADLQPAVALQWQEALAIGKPLTLVDWREAPLARTAQHQVLRTANGGTALIVMLSGDDAKLNLAAISEGLPGVTAVNKTASVSAMFAQYRGFAAGWLPLAALIVLGVLAWRYGLRQGAAILMPTLVAMGVALGAYGLVGVPMTFFSLMALVLALGTGVNYAIFIVEAGDRTPAPFAGVLLSAATTLLAFGLLSFSSMPALHQFGLMLLTAIATAVVLAPMALTLGARR